MRVSNIAYSRLEAMKKEYEGEGVNIAAVTAGESCEYSRSHIHAEFILAGCVSPNVEYLITARGEAYATSASAPTISPKTGMDNCLSWLKGKFTVTLDRTPNKRASAAIGVSQPEPSEIFIVEMDSNGANQFPLEDLGYLKTRSSTTADSMAPNKWTGRERNCPRHIAWSEEERSKNWSRTLADAA